MHSPACVFAAVQGGSDAPKTHRNVQTIVWGKKLQPRQMMLIKGGVTAGGLAV